MHVAASAASLRTLSYRLVHIPGRPENPAKTLGCENPGSAGFSAHLVRAEAHAGQPCGGGV